MIVQMTTQAKITMPNSLETNIELDHKLDLVPLNIKLQNPWAFFVPQPMIPNLWDIQDILTTLKESSPLM